MNRRVLITALLGVAAVRTLRAQPVSPDERREAGEAALALCALLDAGRAEEAVERLVSFLSKQLGVSPAMMPAIKERLRFEIDKRRERGKRRNPRVVAVVGRGGGEIFSVLVEAEAEHPANQYGVVVTSSQEMVEVQRRASGGFDARRYEFKY